MLSPAPHRTPVARVLTCAIFAACAACAGAPPPRSTAASASPAQETSQPAQRARLVLSVVIDQFGSDSLAKLEPLLSPEGAVARVRRLGRVYERVVYPYAATLTAPGHAAIYSGAVPAHSGIGGNYTFDRATGKRRGVVDDGTHAVLGAEGHFAGPGALRVDTVADALKRATGGQGKVASLSHKDRSAILPAGKHADLVLWYDSRVRGFTTSTFYASALPTWLVDYQAAHPIDAPSARWEVPDPAHLSEQLGPDDADGEGRLVGLGTTFPHALSDTPQPYEVWPFFPQSAEALLALAEHAVAELGLGQDDTPDLLAISISSTDYTGHIFGPDSWEYADHLRRVDLALGHLIGELAARTRLAVVITSDHGVAPLPELARAAHPRAARLDPRSLVPTVDAAIDAVAGEGDWVLAYVDNAIFLSQAARTHPHAASMRKAALEALRESPGVAAAYDASQRVALATSDDPIERQVALSLDPDTSGDLYVVVGEHVVPEIGFTLSGGTTHGSPYAYDTTVPVLVLAPGMTPERHGEPLDQRRVASTLAALLGVAPPLADAPPPLPGVVGN